MAHARRADEQHAVHAAAQPQPHGRRTQLAIGSESSGIRAEHPSGAPGYEAGLISSTPRTRLRMRTAASV